MSLILTLKVIANKTKDAELITLLKRLDNYQDRRGCRVTSEIVDGDVLIYDASDHEFLLRIEKNLLHNEAI